MLSRFPIAHIREKSLLRGVLLSVGAFFFALGAAGFPNINKLHGSIWELAALVCAAWGMAETARCLQRRWSLYHAAVLIFLYADLMILAAIVAILTLS